MGIIHQRRHDNETSLSSLPLHQAATTKTKDVTGSGKSRSRRALFRILGVARMLWKAWQSLSVPTRIALLVSFGVAGWFVVRELLYWIPRIEKPLEAHPYWKAIIFNPLRYVHAKYLDADHPKSIRQFVMTPERAFFLNMDRSEQRKLEFQRMNQIDDKGTILVKRFSAHEWVGDEEDHNKGNVTAKRKLQKYWEDRYPFLKLSAQEKHYGDAGCSIAHLLLWQEKLIDSNQDYIFVFEDDVRFLSPLRPRSSKINKINNTDYPIIEAPDVADIVLLVNSAMKRVEVPWEGSTEPAVRVLGGFGTVGYIVTRVGALKLMEWLRTSRKPLDISFFAASSLRVYLPVSHQWPAVRHESKYSTRIGLNEI